MKVLSKDIQFICEVEEPFDFIERFMIWLGLEKPEVVRGVKITVEALIDGERRRVDYKLYTTDPITVKTYLKVLTTDENTFISFSDQYQFLRGS